MCVIWLHRKHCRWTCATTTFYINIYLHREYRKTSFFLLSYCDRRKFNLTVGFFIFLFMVTGRGIIFICSADDKLMKMLIHLIIWWESLLYCFIWFELYIWESLMYIGYVCVPQFKMYFKDRNFCREHFHSLAKLQNICTDHYS